MVPPVSESTRRSFLTGLTVGAGALTASVFASGRVAAQEQTFELDGYTDAWVGLSPSGIEGTDNPTLNMEAGLEYTFVWHNQDSRPHNVIIENAAGENLVRTEIISNGTQEVTFTALPEMTSYYCEVHPQSMRGDVEVSGELEETPTATETPTTEATTTEESPTTTEESTTAEPDGAVHEVAMITDGDEYVFDPIGLHVEPGDTVRFVNESGSHSATAYEDRIPEDTPAFDSGILTEEGAEFEQAFTTEGTVDYYCIPHEDLGMLARLVVGEPGGPASGSMPEAGDVPTESRIVEEGSVSWEAFQEGDGTQDDGGNGNGNGEETATESPGFGIGGAVAAVGIGALIRRLRAE